jgi:nucleoside 2-deoxyribosyltransferase
MAKIYFAGSIRGGRKDRELYSEVISILRRKHIVLTEHVSDPNLFKKEQEENTTDNFIYSQDTNWLKECDVIIAECTVPSLGVGYELCFAEKLGKTAYIFYDDTKCNLSAMLKGDPYYNIIGYSDINDLKKQVESLAEKL